MSYTRLEQEDHRDPLLSSSHSDERLQQREDRYSEKKPHGSKGAHHKLSVLAGVVACLCTLANFALLVISHFAQRSQDLSALASDYSNLEVVSSYVKLDTAVYDIPRVAPKPIVNFPLVISQISEAEPRRVFQDLTTWMSRIGLIFPEEYGVKVSPKVSTIMQFRTLDFGMEKCSIVISLPSKAQSEPGARAADTYKFTPESSLVAWRVYAPHRLNPEKLSWSTRPQRRGVFFSMKLNSTGQSTTYESPEFHCASGTLHTYEFACDPDAKAPCLVEFVEDYKRHDGDLAIYLRQKASF